eukprot:jgi/Mesvir1/10971/Mv07854-RA.2
MDIEGQQELEAQRRPVDANLAAMMSHKLQHENAELKKKLAFYEDQVLRLNNELASYQERDGTTSGGGDPFLQSMAATGQLIPPWVVNMEVLPPLLRAYDLRIEELEGSNRSWKAEVGTLKKRVEEVVGENERLSEEMVRQADMLQRRAQAEHAALPYQTQELLQRLELLTRENDILLEQQRALDGEISSLHAQLDKRATESASLSAEFASIMERLQSGERYLEQLERDKGESDKSVRRLTAERNALREQLQDAQAQCHSLTEQSAQSKGILEETGQRFKADTEALKQQLALLQKRERQAAVNAQTLARELEALREQHGSASRELTTARQDTNEMVQAVSRMEAQLAAYQQKDAEVYQRLKEAMEMAEDAKLARDELLMRERHLENEVASLRDKLKTHYKEIKEQYRQEMASQQAKADKAVTSLTAELHMMEATNAELKLVAEKALRDQRAADVELEHLRATLAAFGASGAAQRNAAATGVTLAGPGLGRGLAGLQGVPEPRPTTLEGPSSASQARRIQELERALDEEQDKQKSVSLSCQRKLNEWERERNSLVTTLTDIRNRAQRAEIEVVERRKQCVQLKASGDELQRVNRALQRAKSLAEKEAKVNYKRMEAEYGNQVTRADTGHAHAWHGRDGFAPPFHASVDCLDHNVLTICPHEGCVM